MRAKPDAFVDVQPLRIDRNPDHAFRATGTFEDRGNSPVCRIFHPRRCVAIEQNLTCKVKPLLRATCNDDLLGLAANRPRLPDVAGHRFAQYPRSLRIAIS